MISSANLMPLLGLSHGHPDVVRLCKVLGGGNRRVVEHLAYLDFSDKGVSFLLDTDGTIDAIFLYSHGYEGHQAFRGELHGGIQFGRKQEAIKSCLGEPESQGGGMIGMFGEVVPKWQRFKLPDGVITVQYDPSSKYANLITLLQK